jgi:aspartate/methionine/tyrosine aminotransferase
MHGDELLFHYVHQQERFLGSPRRSSFVLLSSGMNELRPPPIYQRFMGAEYSDSEILRWYTADEGYPPVARGIQLYETLPAGVSIAADLSDSHRVTITYGGVAAIVGAINALSALSPLRALVVDYAYSVFERAIRGVSGVLMQILPDTPFEPVRLDRLLREIRCSKPNLIIVCNPSNPTGQFYAEEFLRNLFQIAQSSGAWIIYDRVCCFDVSATIEPNYLLIASEEGALDKLIVINSASKTTSLAGLRLGWALCPSAIAQSIGRWQFGISENPPLVAGSALLLDLWMRLRYVSEHKRTGDWCTPTLRTLARFWDADGVERDPLRRRRFLDLLTSSASEDVYTNHVNHFLGAQELFKKNFSSFRRYAGNRLSGWPATWQGFNVMVELHRTSVESIVRLASELLDRTGVSILPDACFAVKPLRPTRAARFRLSLAMEAHIFDKSVQTLMGAWDQ